jgi:hypothetical protein
MTEEAFATGLQGQPTGIGGVAAAFGQSSNGAFFGWVTNPDTDQLLEFVDQDGQTTPTVTVNEPAGAGPAGLALLRDTQGAFHYYVTSQSPGQSGVWEFNATTGAMVRRLKATPAIQQPSGLVPFPPCGVQTANQPLIATSNPHCNHLFVADQASGGLVHEVAIDFSGQNQDVTTTFASSVPLAEQLIWSPDGSILYVAAGTTGDVVQLNSTGSVVNSGMIQLTNLGTPMGLAVGVGAYAGCLYVATSGAGGNAASYITEVSPPNTCLNMSTTQYNQIATADPITPGFFLSVDNFNYLQNGMPSLLWGTSNSVMRIQSTTGGFAGAPSGSSMALNVSKVPIPTLASAALAALFGSSGTWLLRRRARRARA